MAWLVSRPLDSLLFHQSSRDPVVWGGVTLALALVAMLASLLPGWRATLADPTEALRAE
jgi:ABC-type lipoprotein release transport system permease subunit